MLFKNKYGFYKVSLREYIKSNKYRKVPIDYLKKEYENIKLPERSTKNSAGYDFFMPYDKAILSGKDNYIYTGIKCKLKRNRWLMIAPKSGLSNKYKMKLDNTIGVIDADYFNNLNNEGAISVCINTERDFYLKSGDKYVQGIQLPYYTFGDIQRNKRIGGFGSTGR